MISLTLKATPKVRNDVKTRRKKATGERYAGELPPKEEARSIQTDEIHG